MKETHEERIIRLKEYEDGLKKQGKKIIIGIDEAGRGPFAGPVAVGGVVMKDDSNLLYVNDSKKVTEKRREVLFDKIKEDAIAASVMFVWENRIDEINILNATKEGANLVIDDLIKQLKEKDMEADIIIVDSLKGLNTQGIECEPIDHGDANCYSIACASILAKVARDRYMREIDELFPQYKFAKNKGYGTAEHIEALKKYGPCRYHRRSFISKYVQEEES